MWMSHSELVVFVTVSIMYYLIISNPMLLVLLAPSNGKIHHLF
jgi:hypothetical protein